MDNTPIIGCDGCKTSGGRLSCPQHGQVMINTASHICPKHKTALICEKCLEEVREELDDIQYGKIYQPRV